MRALTTTNLDYLTARLHGRRSRMVEGDRLDALCRLRGMPDSRAQTAKEFQQLLVEDLVREVAEFLPLLDRPGARLIEWMLARLCMKLPESWEECEHKIGMVMPEAVRQLPAKPFFMEAVLDQRYYRELLARSADLPEDVQRVVRHEAEEFQRSLFARGQANYGLTPEVLAQFAVLDEIPAKPTERYRLANRVMRRSPTGLGTVVGYVLLRRIEIANLTTISEGIRLGLSEEIIRRRVTHV
jgi:hypothetical protein